MSSLASAFAALVLLSPAALCDLVKLKNGAELSGVVVSKEGGMVVLRMPHGEIGFDASLVESIDTAQGLTQESLTKAEEEGAKAAEASTQERIAALRARRAAVRAAEASAVLDRGAAEPAAEVDPVVAEAERAAADAQARLVAIDEVLAGIPTARERVAVRRALLAYYFGVSPTASNTRSNAIGPFVGPLTPKSSTSAAGAAHQIWTSVSSSIPRSRHTRSRTRSMSRSASSHDPPQAFTK